MSSQPELWGDLPEQVRGVRFKVPHQWTSLREGIYIDPDSVQALTHEERLIEELMLKLRTDQRIPDFAHYAHILEPSRKDLLADRQAHGRIVYDEGFGRQMQA